MWSQTISTKQILIKIMKFKIITCLTALLFTMTNCAQKPGAQNNVSPESKNKILVAYFSATGTTKKVAEEIAKEVNGTLFEIEPETPYSEADLDWKNKESRSSVEMADSTSRPPIKNKVPDMAQYDTVFIGFPVWWYVAPTIINTFIDENDLKGKTIITFATSGGSPIEPCDSALQKTYPDLDWKGGKLLNRPTPEELKEWVKQLSL